MKEQIHQLDVVALLQGRVELGLVAGQVGTVVEVLDANHFEVEFSDDEGRTYAMATFGPSELMVLHYSPAAA